MSKKKAPAPDVPEVCRSARAVEESLRLHHFDSNGWTVLSNVRSTMGHSADLGYADLVAMCTWPSRGLELHGVEIKISRGDFLRERKNPAKAEQVARHCDKWWLAISEESIAKPEEVPAAWGLMLVKPNKVRVLAKPTKLPQSDLRAPIPRMFVAALMRSAQAQVDLERQRARAEVEQDVMKRHDANKAKLITDALEREQAAVKSRNKAVAELNAFREALGANWESSPPKVAHLLQLSQSGGLLRQVRETAKTFEGASDALNKALTELSALTQELTPEGRLERELDGVRAVTQAIHNVFGSRS